MPDDPPGPAGPVLPDGTYDAFVIDATTADQPSLDGTTAMTLDLTITTGEHKGEVLTITATGLAQSDVDLLGMPATLTVADGKPTIQIDG